MSRRRGKLGFYYLVSAGVLVLTVLGCVVYALSDQWMVYVRVRQVAAANETSTQAIDWLTARPTLSLPALVDMLESPDAVVCRRTGAVVERILREHADPTNPADSHITLGAAALLNQRFAALSEPGRRTSTTAAFLVLRHQLRVWSPNVPTALTTAGEIVRAAMADESANVRSEAFAALRDVWRWNGAQGVALTPVRQWKLERHMQAVNCLADDRASIRAAAAAALRGTPFHEGELTLAARLEDSDPTVRKAALLTLATNGSESISADQKKLLAGWLHDEDAEITAAARRILRACGLSDETLTLLEVVMDPNAARRAAWVDQTALSDDRRKVAQYV
ncbi:MAG: HEAT repeat domain-containing protein, partial [Planctomycetia bacterium]